ncbi:MAG: hypothetical protein GW748_02080 [Alphaproteobacteria bacterium]|nr:hypothetical protein [Alphaproteobacteria bacterium]NCQ66515.1 hypothetical protein [Alphaproteobacteria bacterium]NCT08306.1 hypothetical protein [Alphaproteobacteria bacterium]
MKEVKTEETVTIAIQWDSSNKSLSYMIIDSEYEYILKPQIFSIDTSSSESAEPSIRNVFKHIEKYLVETSTVYKIESKTPHIHTPYTRAFLERNLSHEVGKKVADCITELSRKYPLLTKSPVLKANLKRGKGLRRFQAGLRYAGLYTKADYAWLYKLWVIALHATQSSWEKMLRKLYVKKGLDWQPQH